MNQLNCLFLLIVKLWIAIKMFGVSDTLFEHLAEYLSQNIVGHGDLKTWFDQPMETAFENRFGLTPGGFSQATTSRSIKNVGGGYLNSNLKICELKMDAVQLALAQFAAPEADDSVDVNARMARFAALMKRAICARLIEYDRTILICR